MERNLQRSAEVVICGAGMAGVCTAYWLAQAGMHGIVLVDRQPPLSLTSDKSAETYCRWWPEPSMFGFVTRSTEIMESLARETNNLFNLNRAGEAYVATSHGKAADFAAMVEQFSHLGLGPTRVHRNLPSPYPPASHQAYDRAPAGSDLLLGQNVVSQHFPYLSDRVTAVLHARGCGWFSAHTLGMHLLECAKEGGVRELRAEVIGIDQDPAGVSAVRIVGYDGPAMIQTRCLVNAAGPFVKQVGTLLGIDLPVRTGLWEKIVIRDHLGIVPRTAPTVILKDELWLEWSDEERAWLCDDKEHRWLLNRFSSGPYLRPEGGADSQWLMLGWAYNEPPYRVHREREADRVGAGAVCDPQWVPRLTKEFPEIVLRGAARMVPGLSRYLDRMPKPMHDGGYYVETRDVDGEAYGEENPPLVGPMGVAGAFVVSACHGVSGGCAAGELCAAWVTGGKLPDYASEFSLHRYGLL